MKTPQEMKTIFDFSVGFFCYVLILFLILLCIKATGWSALLMVSSWTFLWLLFYTQHVSNVAIQSHKENMRKEALPNSEDINGDVDKIIYKGGKGQCLKM